MTTTVIELYEALRAANVDEAQARAAAAHVIGREEASQFATKADITELRLEMRALLADTKADIIKWNVGTMLTLTAAWIAIATVLRVFIK